MKKIALFLCLTSICFSSCSDHKIPSVKRTALEREGIRGKVKSLEDWNYRAVVSSDGIVPSEIADITEYLAIPNGFAREDKHSHRTFGENGEIGEFIVLLSNGYIHTKSTAEYRDDGYIGKLTALDSRDTLIYTASYEDYDSDMQYHTINITFYNGMVVNESLDKRTDGDQRTMRWERYMSPPSTYIGYHETVFSGFSLMRESLFDPREGSVYIADFAYNEDNWKTQTRYGTISDGTERTDLYVSYDYVKKDDNGNWTERHIYVADSEDKPDNPKYITIRKIEYYED